MSKSERGGSDRGERSPNKDTRWIKYGTRPDGEFTGEHAAAFIDDSAATPVVPRLEIHPILREGEVRLSLGVVPAGDERTPSVSAMGSYTPEQIFELTDALEEVAGAARDGEVQ
jgi:hypothetical protein